MPVFCTDKQVQPDANSAGAADMCLANAAKLLFTDQCQCIT